MGKFEPGRKKTGGRRPGTPNRATREAAELHGRILEFVSGRIGIDALLEGCRPEAILNYLGRTMPKNLTIETREDDERTAAEKLEIFRKHLETLRSQK